MNTTDSLIVPRGLIASALALANLVAVPLLAFAFLIVAGISIASLGVAAAGINYVLGLPYLNFFPEFPPVARILSGLSLLAFAALLTTSTLLIWRIFKAIWKRFWSWSRSAWQGTFTKLLAFSQEAGDGKSLSVYWLPIRVSALVFLGLFAISFILMMFLAAGPFWHTWHWFS
jgi:hypothetical protein